MRTIKKYQFSEKVISSMFVDTTFPGFLWVAFEKEGTTCLLRKIGAHNLNQIYYELNVDCDKIIKLDSADAYISLAIEHNDYLGYKYSKTAPSSVLYYVNRPSGIIEMPVDFIATSTNLYFLMPGNTSGENTKIVKTSVTGVFQETIDLVKSGEEIRNAISFVKKDNDFWVVTSDNPSLLVRVYQDMSLWTFTSYNLGDL